jgi:hypothetical protein
VPAIPYGLCDCASLVADRRSASFRPSRLCKPEVTGSIPVRSIVSNGAENGRLAGIFLNSEHSPGSRRFVTVATAKNRYCQRFSSGAAVFQRLKSVPPGLTDSFEFAECE